MVSELLGHLVTSLLYLSVSCLVFWLAILVKIASGHLLHNIFGSELS